MKALYLPSITGQFSHWRYYQMIMSVENIVEELPIYQQILNIELRPQMKLMR